MIRAILLLALLASSWAAEVPARSAALTVSVVAPRSESWPATVRSDGDIAAWQELVVAAEVGGLRLAELLAEVGDPVSAGQVLARLDDRALRAELAAQEAAVAEAEATLAQAAADARRSEDAGAGGTFSQQQRLQFATAERAAIARLAAARARLDSQRLALERTVVVARDDGVVSARAAEPGAVVQVGAELFRLVRRNRLEWRAAVTAGDLALVRGGQRARVEVAGFGATTAASVRSVAPGLDPRTRTALVYIDLPAGFARPGLFATGEIEVGAPAPLLTLPAAAVVVRDGRALVFALGADGRVQELRVATGRRQGGRVEIVSGLDSAARVVAGGGAFLADGDRVTVVEP